MSAVLIVLGCSNADIEARLEKLTGDEFLALSEAEKSALVDDSLARFTTWRFWARPDLCEYVLNRGKIMSLYEASAEKARDKPMMFYFAVRANEECVNQDQSIK